MSEAALALKGMAKALHVPVIAVSHDTAMLVQTDTDAQLVTVRPRILWLSNENMDAMKFAKGIRPIVVRRGSHTGAISMCRP